MNQISIFILLLACLATTGQPFPKYVVPAGANAGTVIPDEAEYSLPDFSDGYVVTKEGNNSSILKLNFNFLLNEPLMINAAGDTATMISEIVKLVWIGAICYTNTNMGYMEILSHGEPIALAMRKYLRVFRREHYDPKVGVVVSRSSQAVNGQLATAQSPLNNWVQNEQRSFKMETEYYFITSGNKADRAKKSEVLRLFRASQDKLKTFIDDNVIDFSSESDLKKIVAFCQTL